EAGGQKNVVMKLGFVGVQAPSYPDNTIHLWTGGPQEAVLQVQLRRGAGVNIEAFQERLRHALPPALPNVQFTFEASDIVSRVMSFGSPTPIEVAVTGPSLKDDAAYAG